MAMELDLDTVVYSVVLVDSETRGILVHDEGGTFRIPRVSIPSGTRIARQLRSELLRMWGITAIVLDFLSTDDDASVFVIAEVLAQRLPTGFRVVHTDEIPNNELPERARMLLLRVLGDDVQHPFSSIGWLDEVITWVECVTGQRVHSRTSIEQHNAGGAFTLLHFRMELGPSYWLKATGVPNANERLLTGLLSKVCGRYLPTFIAEKVDWNAWLMAEEGCSISALPLEPDNLVRLLRQAVESLAEIQLKTVGRDQPLLDAGAFDQRLQLLQADANTLFAHVAEAMSFQTSTKVLRIENRRLQELRNHLEEACHRLDGLNIPSTILHGDMNLGNLVFTKEHCQFIDWCEGYVGHPFVTLQHLLLLNPLEDATLKASVENQLKGIYANAMRSVCDPRQMTESFACMPFIAAASALYGRGDWIRSDIRHDPRRHRYARGMARHMDRAAREPAFLNALCV